MASELPVEHGGAEFDDGQDIDQHDKSGERYADRDIAATAGFCLRCGGLYGFQVHSSHTIPPAAIREATLSPR